MKKKIVLHYTANS